MRFERLTFHVKFNRSMNAALGNSAQVMSGVGFRSVDLCKRIDLPSSFSGCKLQTPLMSYTAKELQYAVI